jgi:transcriptional regulator with XRE-family HTH domain
MPRSVPQPYLEFIAANVRRARTRLGLTQEQLAARADFEHRFIQRVERAKLDMRMSTFLRIADALGVPPAALLRRRKLEPAKPGRPRTRTRSGAR